MLIDFCARNKFVSLPITKSREIIDSSVCFSVCMCCFYLVFAWRRGFTYIKVVVTSILYFHFDKLLAAFQQQSISPCVIRPLMLNAYSCQIDIFPSSDTEMSFKLTLSHEIQCSINYRTWMNKKQCRSA